jgi:hypothetical protein
MQATQAKFRCDAHNISKYQGGETTKIVLNAVTAYSSPEDKPFWDATPTGSIEIQVANKHAQDFFVPGKKYLVTFTPVDE